MSINAYLKSLDELTNIAFKIGVASDLSNNRKRQVGGYIAKYYEYNINDLEKTDGERMTLLRQIS